MTRLFKCSNCGGLFPEPVLYDPHTDQTRRSGADPCLVCDQLSPCCFADYEEVTECDKCGAFVPAAELRHGLCGKCVQAAVAQFKYFLANEFTETEREAINDAYEGTPLTEGL